jgi:hypothetical protein
VRIDAGEPLIPENEPSGTHNLQAHSTTGGQFDKSFIGQLRDQQRKNCAALGYPMPPDAQ